MNVMKYYKNLAVVNIILSLLGAFVSLYFLYVLIFVIPRQVDWYVTNGLNIQTNLLCVYLMFLAAGLFTYVNFFNGKKLLNETNSKKRSKKYLYSSITTIIGFLVLLMLFVGLISL